MSRVAHVAGPSRQRSAVTNGRRLLAGIDGNSALARRYRDLVEMLTEEAGGASLSEGQRLQVRNAATLQMHAEELTAAMVRGEAVDSEAITRAANGASRALAALAKTKPAERKPKAPGVAAYIASKVANA